MAPTEMIPDPVVPARPSAEPVLDVSTEEALSNSIPIPAPTAALVPNTSPLTTKLPVPWMKMPRLVAPPLLATSDPVISSFLPVATHNPLSPARVAAPTSTAPTMVVGVAVADLAQNPVAGVLEPLAVVQVTTKLVAAVSLSFSNPVITGTVIVAAPAPPVTVKEPLLSP